MLKFQTLFEFLPFTIGSLFIFIHILHPFGKRLDLFNETHLIVFKFLFEFVLLILSFLFLFDSLVDLRVEFAFLLIEILS